MSSELITNVFIGCPINEVKEYCIDEYFEHALKLEYPNKVYYFVDNSPTEHFSEKMRSKHGLNIDWLNPKKYTNPEYMCASMNMCRAQFLNTDCEYWLILECDIFPPISVIPHLLGLNKDIVGLPYMTGEGREQFVIATEIEPVFGEIIRHVSSAEGYIKHNGKLNKKDMVGFGCVLVHRSIVEENAFYISKRQKIHADTFFYLDMFDFGVDVWRDDTIICRHDNVAWKYISDYNK